MEVTGSNLTIIPDANFNGDVEIVVLVSDGEDYDESSFLLTVLPVNDAPVVVNSIDNINMLEDEDSYSIDIQDVFNDIDGDILNLSSSNEYVLVNISNNNLTIFLPEDYNGSDEIFLFASDGQESVSTSFVLTVTPVNDAPILSDLFDSETDEDNDFIIELGADDIDQDDLTFSVSIDGNGSFSIIDNILTISPDLNFNGSIDVDVSVTDGVLNDSGSFILNVNAVNDAPNLEIIENQSVDEDSSIVINLSASDVDGDAIYFGAEVDGNSSLSLNSSELTIVPDLDFSGDIIVSISATDTQASSLQSFILTVNPVNDAPILELISNQNILEDETFSYILEATDVDEDILEFSISLV